MDRITVETDLFEHREVKPHFINPCCFGEDFAAWLKQELSRFPELGQNYPSRSRRITAGTLGFPRQGSLLDRSFYVGKGPQEAPAQWVISVTYDPGLNLAKRLFHKPDRQTLTTPRSRPASPRIEQRYQDGESMRHSRVKTCPSNRLVIQVYVNNLLLSIELSYTSVCGHLEGPDKPSTLA